MYEHWSDGLLNRDLYKRQLEKLAAERSEIDRKLVVIENINSEEIEGRAKTLLELCKRAECALKKGSEEERLSLIKRLCSNFRLNGASLEFDLNIPFAKVLEFKRNTDNTKWRP